MNRNNSVVQLGTMTAWNKPENVIRLILFNFFPIHDSVPKAQKSQGQGLANEVFFVYGSFATVVRVCVRTCLRADMSPTFLTCLRKVILRDILN